jgi:hypothetical protein
VFIEKWKCVLMIFDEPSDQVEGFKLSVPVVVIGKVLNEIFDSDLSAV